ncbi:MAG TPA: hypothetical protein VFG76_10695, partial [Candidatus Polarisedimenticolia bacterium]|nr:hypothetical protein [Candidatus Polarisedimenticolia bacterium]
EFLNDPTRGSAYVSSLASAAVPNIVAKAAQAIDPVIRDTTPSQSGLAGLPEKVAKTIQSRIPGLSSSLPARKEPTGGEATRPGEGLLGAASRFLSPVQISKEKEGGDLERLLVDIDAVPGQPSRDFTLPGARGTKIRLNEDEYAILQRSNEIAADYLRRLVASPGFERLSPEEKKNRVESVFRRARSLQSNRLLHNLDFRRRARAFLKEQATA